MTLYQRLVVLLHGVARMRQMLRKIAVVCQQEQAAGVDVEATNGVHTQTTQFGRKQVKDGRSSLRVTHGSHVAYGFMQRQVNAFGKGMHRFAIDSYDVVFRVNARSLPGDGDSVHLHSSSSNEFFSVPPGRYARLREKSSPALPIF